jgi:UDP-N-acetylmuramyl pentapeptide phosphotransferase/UDP-N-acetylglucosamine-1-phosphate transferase
MHDDATQLAAFGLASFALVAALIPLVGVVGRSSPARRQTESGTRWPALALLLVAEVALACILFAAGVRVHLAGDDADLALTVAWLVGLTSAFRVLDANVRGSAAVVGSGVAIAIAVAAALDDQTLVGDVAAILAGASAAAVLYNWYPARLRLTTSGTIVLGFVLGSLALYLRYPSTQPAGAFAVGLVSASPLFLAALVTLDGWRRRRPERIAGEHHRGAASPTVVADMFGAATAALAVTGVAIVRDAIPAWVAYPAAATSAVLLLACLAVLERRRDDPHSAFAGPEQRRLLELLPAADVPPAEITALDPAWAATERRRVWGRARGAAAAPSFSTITDPGDIWLRATPEDTTVGAIEAEAPADGDALSFHWPPESANGDSDSAAPVVEDPEPPTRRPELSTYLERRQEPAPDEEESADVDELQADVRDLVRMTRTMLDALAAQLDQNAESARLVTGQLGSTESQLANVAEQLGALTENLASSPAPAADGDGEEADAEPDERQDAETRLQAFIGDVRALRVPEQFDGVLARARRIQARIRTRRNT